MRLVLLALIALLASAAFVDARRAGRRRRRGSSNNQKASKGRGRGPGELTPNGNGDYACNGVSIASMVGDRYPGVAVAVACSPFAGTSFKLQCSVSTSAEAFETRAECRASGVDFKPELPEELYVFFLSAGRGGVAQIVIMGVEQADVTSPHLCFFRP